MKRLRSEVVSMAAAAAKESLNKSLSFVKEVKDTFGGETQEYHQFKKLFLDLQDDRISIDGLLIRLSELFHGHNNLIVKFNSLHSKIRPPISSHNNNNNNNNDIGNKSSSSGSNNIGDYEDGSDESPPKKSSSSSNNIGDHVLELEQDACCGEKTPPNKIKKKYEDAIDFFTRIFERLKYDDERAYRLLLDTMAMFGKREVTSSGVYSRVALILEKYPDLLEEFKEYFLSEFSEEELRITPIYLILPGSNDDEVIIGGDHQEEVLNNVCVLAAPGTWDFSSTPEDRKEYEDLSEDQRLEMDLLLETLISTTEQLKECLAKVNSIGPLVNIKEHLKPRNLSCINNVYGAHSKDVIDMLKQKPKAALPVVLVRLTQKQKELKKFRSDFKYGMSLNVQTPKIGY